MPIPNVTVTGPQFDYLQNNISQQSDSFTAAGGLAYSGLQYVVLLQVAAPEVDLLTPFASQYTNMDSFNSTANFTQVVASLNLHVINRGTVANIGETLASRLNRWLSDHAVLVTQTYANISSGAGFVIDPGNIL